MQRRLSGGLWGVQAGVVRGSSHGQVVCPPERAVPAEHPCEGQRAADVFCRPPPVLSSRAEAEAAQGVPQVKGFFGLPSPWQPRVGPVLPEGLGSLAGWGPGLVTGESRERLGALGSDPHRDLN